MPGSTPEAENPYGLAPFAGQERPDGTFQVTLPRDHRPGSVVAGAVIAIVQSSLVLAGAVVMAIFFAASDLTSYGIDVAGADRAAIVFVCTMFAVLCIAAIIFAALAMRRQPGARLALLLLGLLSAAIDALVTASNFGADNPGGGVVMLLFLLATVGSLALLLTPAAGRWYLTRPPAGHLIVPYR